MYSSPPKTADPVLLLSHHLLFDFFSVVKKSKKRNV